MGKGGGALQLGGTFKILFSSFCAITFPYVQGESGNEASHQLVEPCTTAFAGVGVGIHASINVCTRKFLPHVVVNEHQRVISIQLNSVDLKKKRRRKKNDLARLLSFLNA